VTSRIVRIKAGGMWGYQDRETLARCAPFPARRSQDAYERAGAALGDASTSPAMVFRILALVALEWAGEDGAARDAAGKGLDAVRGLTPHARRESRCLCEAHAHPSAPGWPAAPDA